MKRHMVVLGLFMTAWLSSAALADTITLKGTTIPMRGVQIEGFQDGAVYFIAGRARRVRSLDEISSLGFDQTPALDEGEAALQDDDLDGALLHLLKASIEADTDVQRLWIHARLARVHDSRGEFVQAAGHLGAVLKLQEAPYWRNLEPLSEPDEPGYPAAIEAMRALDAARRSAQTPGVRQFLDDLHERVRIIHDRLATNYAGPAIEPGTTISGFSIENIRSGNVDELGPAGRPPDQSAPPPDPVRPPPDEPPTIPPTGGGRSAPPPVVTDDGSAIGPDSAGSIQALLDAGRAREALAICRRVEERPGGRPLDEFLFQYGHALNGEGQPRDAAVMYLRCALLFPDSTHAPVSLIEAAIIHRDTFRQHPAARRLLERAAAAAERLGRGEDAARARALIDSLDPSSEDGEV